MAFPSSDNSSFTKLLGTEFNLTTLTHWNYTFYPINQTLSNGSRCYLVFEPYTPILLPNGTFLNSSSCYSAILPMGQRSEIGLAFVVLFTISIVVTLVNLRKHGRLFLPSEKRFLPVGRRWQWYWMLFVAAMAIISGIANVDVERYYVSEIPIVISNFAWFLMLPATMAIVWESVRHWGSWQERQIVDPNPFILRQDDDRSKVEFYLPLVFYLFFWLNFFMVVPRSWTPIELQRSPSQTALEAEPTATDTRFKIGAFFLFCSWITSFFSLCHSIYHYKPHHLPPKQLLLLFLSLVMIGYETTIAFDFSLSPLNRYGTISYIFGLGWAPIFLIVAIVEIWGYLESNEDRELIRQRRSRGAELDYELGIVKKPHWWKRLKDNHSLNVRDQIARNVGEIGGGAATANKIDRTFVSDMPISDDYSSPYSRPEELKRAGLSFPGSPHEGIGIGSPALGTDPLRTGVPSANKDTRDDSRRASHANTETSSVTLGGPSQQIRSMLDV